VLRIDRQDEPRILDWLEENDNFKDIPTADSGRKGLVFDAAWLPLLLSFLNGVVLVDKYAGGLVGLLEKAKKIIDWVRGKTQSTKLTTGERILGLLLQKSRQGLPIKAGELAGLSGAKATDVTEALTRLKAAGIVEELDPGSWILADS
jgi:hypothetical protein